MKPHDTKSLAATLLVLALPPLAACARPAESPAPADDRSAYNLKIEFRGLTTLVPDDTGEDPVFWALLGDYRDPSKLTVYEAELGGHKEKLAKHEARLYFRNVKGATASGWTIQTVDNATNCYPPKPADGVAPADRFIVLDGDDLIVSGGQVNPPLTLPKRPAHLPETPDHTVTKGSWGWVPDLYALTGQKVHADLFGARPCSACRPKLAARLRLDRGRVSTTYLWEKAVGNYSTWKFDGVGGWGPHALAGWVAVKGTVVSGDLVFESRTFDGTATRRLTLPALDAGETRSVWITNNPFEGPPDCKGGLVDFIGHHNLLANPGGLTGRPPYPVSYPPDPPVLDGQCSPAGGGR